MPRCVDHGVGQSWDVFADAAPHLYDLPLADVAEVAVLHQTMDALAVLSHQATAGRSWS